MIRKGLVDAIKQRVPTVEKRMIEKIIDAFFAAIYDGLAEDGRVSIKYWMSFVRYNKRRGKNFQTGEPVAPKFPYGAKLKLHKPIVVMASDSLND